MLATVMLYARFPMLLVNNIASTVQNSLYLLTASSGGTTDAGDPEAYVNGILGATESDGFSGLTNSAQQVSKGLFNLSQIIVYAVAMIVGGLIGINFMIRKTGQAKEENKSWVGSFVIGAIIAFGIVAIVRMLGNFAQGLFSEAAG